MDTVEVTVADIERMMDRMALEQGWLDGKTPYHAAAEKLDKVEGGSEFRPLLLHALRKILELRVADPKGFDVTVLKTLCPEMTHNDLAQAMTALQHAGWSHRARSREAVKRLVERFPALCGLLSFDRRGGDRHSNGRATPGHTYRRPAEAEHGPARQSTAEARPSLARRRTAEALRITALRRTADARPGLARRRDETHSKGKAPRRYAVHGTATAGLSPAKHRRAKAQHRSEPGSQHPWGYSPKSGSNPRGPSSQEAQPTHARPPR